MVSPKFFMVSNLPQCLVFCNTKFFLAILGVVWYIVIDFYSKEGSLLSLALVLVL